MSKLARQRALSLCAHASVKRVMEAIDFSECDTEQCSEMERVI